MKEMAADLLHIFSSFSDINETGLRALHTEEKWKIIVVTLSVANYC